MRRWQALISLALAAAVAAATLGIAPTPAAIRKVFGLSGEPFPCQDHACGCSSAADCFDDCCCFTPAQLAAWRGARSKPAGAPAPDSEDHCDLCESAAPAAPSPAPVALISALTCRAVALSIAWAPPLLGAPAPFELRVECATPALLCPGGQRAPAAPSREIPTPPPRF